jgi:hypothetical protein
MCLSRISNNQGRGKKNFTKIYLETSACLHYEEIYRINKNSLLAFGESDKTGNIKKIAPTWYDL